MLSFNDIAGIETVPYALALNGPDGYSKPRIAAQPSGATTIGLLRVIGPELDYDYEILSDPSDKFSIDGDELVTSGPFNYNVAQSHTLTIRATAQLTGVRVEGTLSIPVDAAVSAPATVYAPQMTAIVTGAAAVPSMALGNIQVIPIQGFDLQQFVINSTIMGQQYNLTATSIVTGAPTLQAMPASTGDLVTAAIDIPNVQIGQEFKLQPASLAAQRWPMGDLELSKLDIPTLSLGATLVPDIQIGTWDRLRNLENIETGSYVIGSME